MNYDEIEAGPECDLLIATKVLKLRTGTRHHDKGLWTSPDGTIWRRLQDYSGDPTDCMAALEKMAIRYKHHTNPVILRQWIAEDGGTGWSCELGYDADPYDAMNYGNDAEADGDTMMLAACRAMMKAADA